MSQNIEAYAAENPDRFAMLKEACERLTREGTVITHAALAKVLPDDFCLDDPIPDPWRVLAGMVAIDTEMSAKETPDRAVDDLDFLDDAESDPEAIRQRVRDLDMRAAKLRGKIQTLTNERGRARAALADSIAAYQGLGPRVSRDTLIRDYLKSSQIDRARQATGDADMPTVPTFGPSVIDKSAGYGRGGNASDHVRQHMRNGGYRRGSFPGSAKGSRLRPPSERA